VSMYRVLRLQEERRWWQRYSNLLRVPSYVWRMSGVVSRMMSWPRCGKEIHYGGYPFYWSYQNLQKEIPCARTLVGSGYIFAVAMSSPKPHHVRGCTRTMNDINQSYVCADRTKTNKRSVVHMKRVVPNGWQHIPKYCWEQKETSPFPQVELYWITESYPGGKLCSCCKFC
jgi:hypothetical protein